MLVFKEEPLLSSQVMRTTDIATQEIVHTDVALTFPTWNVAENVREQFRKVKTALPVSESKSLCVAVCSCECGEGVSWVASKLACAIAEDPCGSVLVVDARQSRPTQATLFGLETADAKEIASEGTVPFLFRSSSSPHLSLITPSLPSRDSAPILNAALRSVLPSLRRLARVVIIDCDPMSSSAQLLHLGAAIDCVLFVVEAERERREVIGRSLEALKRAGILLSGVLINKRKRYIPDALYKLL